MKKHIISTVSMFVVVLAASYFIKAHYNIFGWAAEDGFGVVVFTMAGISGYALCKDYK